MTNGQALARRSRRANYGERWAFDETFIADQVLVTPLMADTWLVFDQASVDVHNRTPSTGRVDRYARDMLNDNWKFSGAPIVFDKDGYILDGLQRLMAVVRSGKSIVFNLQFGIERDAQTAMDRPRLRTFADDARMRGVSNSMVVASCATLLLRWRAGRVMTASWQPTPPEVSQFIDDSPRVVGDDDNDDVTLLVLAAREATRINRLVTKIAKSVLAAAWHEAQLIDSNACTEFFEGLYTGANLDVTSPILALNKTISRYGNERRAKPRQSYQLYQVVKAWNLYRDGKPARTIVVPENSLTSENFPRMK